MLNRKQLIYDKLDELREKYYQDDNFTMLQVKDILLPFIKETYKNFYYEKIGLINKILCKRFVKKSELEVSKEQTKKLIN